MPRLEEKTPENVEPPEIAVEEAPKRVVAADEGIEGLKKQLAAEKERREAAERQAQAHASDAFRAKSEVEDTNLQLVSNAIETVKGHTAGLRNAYADAMAKGEFTKAADLQLEMAGNAAKLLQLETGRQAMAEKPKQPAPVADPVEALARQLTPRSAAWVRAHPEYATDKNYRKMVRAHEDAIDDGMKADSDEYFSAVEARLGLNRQEAAEEGEGDGMALAAQPVARRSSPAAAPVSRSSPSTPGNPRVVRLSADEREMARLNKMSDQEYYEQKQKISRDTRYN